jgi:DNA invertase Pin-like site-specific DNA recombinase
MKLAIYRRVSSKRQVTEGESLEGQMIKVKAWCKANGHTIVSDYVDKGLSGYRGNRPAFNQLLEDVGNPNCEFSGVVVYALSRISRGLLILLKAVDKLTLNNKNIFSVSENLPTDKGSFNLMLAIQGAVAQNQSDINSLFVKDRLTETAEQGYFTGGLPPFGYISIPVKKIIGKKARKVLAVNEEEAEIVKKIFNLARFGLDGKALGLKAIATTLNQLGISHRNNKWTISTLSLMLNNTCYYGDRVFRKNKSLDSKHPKIITKIPAIVTKDIFDEVNRGLQSRMLKNNKIKAIRSPSLLTGILKCYKCGSNMMISTGKSGQYHYYKCGNRIRKDIHYCDSPSIPKLQLESAILETIREEILSKQKIDSICELIKTKIRDTAGETKNSRIVKEHQLSNVTSGINNLYHQVSQNQLKLDETLSEFLESQKKEQKTLEIEIELIKKRTNLALWKFGDNQKELFIKVIREVFSSGNVNASKAYLLAIVDKIIVRPNEIEVSGANMKLLNTISETKMGTSIEVPIYVSIWR